MTMTSIPSRWVVTETDLSTSPDVFPSLPGQGFVEKSPTFSTLTRTASSGRESRVARWSAPRWTFKLSYEVLRNRVSLPELTTLWGFFCTALGSYGAWFFHDAFDDTVTAGPLGTGDGVTTQFQACRKLAQASAFAFNDPVYCFWLVPTVFVNGIPATAFTVLPWGVIQFTSPPANGAVLTWSGQFLFPCRFDQDDINATQMTHDLFSQGGIKFMSLKP